jgi:hypothetical protein
MSTRTECIICCGKLNLLFKRDSYPITANPPKNSQKYEDDIVSNQTFYSCKQCSCVQLGDLVDPLLLYKDALNNTQNTPHALFIMLDFFLVKVIRIMTIVVSFEII